MNRFVPVSVSALLLALPAVAQSGSIIGLGASFARASGISPDGNAIAGYGSNQTYYWTTTFPAWQSTGDGRGSESKVSNGAAFLSFRAAGPWFHDVAWDLGFLALRSEGTSVAVLAATDA